SPDDDGDINLSWNLVSGATSYNVYRYSSLITGINGSLTLVGSSVMNSISDLNQSNGTYYYVVIAINNYGESDPSNCEMVIVVINPSNSEIVQESLLTITWISVIIGLFALVSVFGIIVYRRKRKASFSTNNEEKIQKSSEQIKKLTGLFSITKKVNIESVTEVMGMSRVELIDYLIENRASLKGILIDGDYIIMSSEDDISEFAALLDNQFESWKNKEKSKKGKI
ncbi:MAG: hypothetical protein ACTSWY_14830, partial [Promethearchaeota archaeon]